MTTILVTRPREDSEGVAADLAARGLDALVEPLLSLVDLDTPVDAGGVQGILATSANGVRALARVLPDRTLPVLAVGDASAKAARDSGYAHVESAGGDVDSLAALVRRICTPQAGAFLHAAGTVTAGDLSGQLTEAGFTVRRVVLYEAKTAQNLSPALTAALRDGAVDGALFFSPRTAATFATLVRAAGLDHTTTRIRAYALSAAVAAELSALSWGAVRVAAAPTRTALLAALDDDQRMMMTQTAETPPVPQPATPEPSTPEQPEADDIATLAAAEKSTPWAAIIAALVLVAVIGGGVATWPEWRHRVLPQEAPVTPVQTTQAVDELEALRTELAATREHLRQLETRLAQPPAGAATDVTPLENRLGQAEAGLRALQAQPKVPAQLTEDLAALSKQVDELKRNSADAAAVLRLSDRVDKAESALREMQSRKASASALMLAVGQLREALAKAMPYDAELRAIRALGGSDAEIIPALELLRPRALTGIPTIPMLFARFEAQAPVILRAQILPDEQNWWRQTLNQLASVVTIRREDGTNAGDTPAAMVARAEASLDQDDLAGAVAEMEGLTGGPAAEAANWLADAKARLAADKAASELTAHVVAIIGAGQ